MKKNHRKWNKLSGLLCITVLLSFLAVGCMTARPYSFSQDPARTAAIHLMRGNPSVTLITCNGEKLPTAEDKEYWDPVIVPCGKELELKIHTEYSHSANIAGGLLGALASAAVSSALSVNTDVLFICPPLEEGKSYMMEFKKGKSFPKNGMIVITDSETGEVIVEQIFQTKKKI